VFPVATFSQGAGDQIDPNNLNAFGSPPPVTPPAARSVPAVASLPADAAPAFPKSKYREMFWFRSGPITAICAR